MELAMGAQQMHAAVLHAIGETPRYEPFPVPVAGDGEAVVTVTAAALKPSDRLMANGAHYAPAAVPQVVGLDGVGRLADGSRVAFFIPQQPYGGMAEQTLVRAGVWLPVPDGADDVTAAAFLNPGVVLVGMSAGEVAGLPAMALRAAPVQIFGSGIGGRAGLAESAAAFESLLDMAAAGEITLDVDPVPLSGVEKAWAHPDGGRRVIFVP
jgi:NADPH:quinone reductase-like Zn-dependent oxidoreductase